MKKWFKVFISLLVIVVLCGCGKEDNITRAEESDAAKSTSFFDVSAQEILDKLIVTEGLEFIDLKMLDPVAKNETEEIIYPYYFYNSLGSISLHVTENASGKVTSIIFTTKVNGAGEILTEYPVMVEAIILMLKPDIDTLNFRETYNLVVDKEDIVSGDEGDMEITSIQSAGNKTLMITRKES